MDFKPASHTRMLHSKTTLHCFLLFCQKNLVLFWFYVISWKTHSRIQRSQQQTQDVSSCSCFLDFLIQCKNLQLQHLTWAQQRIPIGSAGARTNLPSKIHRFLNEGLGSNRVLPVITILLFQAKHRPWTKFGPTLLPEKAVFIWLVMGSCQPHSPKQRAHVSF